MQKDKMKDITAILNDSVLNSDQGQQPICHLPLTTRRAQALTIGLDASSWSDSHGSGLGRGRSTPHAAVAAGESAAVPFVWKCEFGRGDGSGTGFARPFLNVPRSGVQPLARNALHGCFAAQAPFAARPRKMGSIVER